MTSVPRSASTSRWRILGAAFTIIGIAFGALFSLSVFLLPIVETMGWNRGAISTVALLNWLSMGAGSFFWGSLSDRLGARAVTASGALLLGAALVVSSQATTLPWFFVSFGVVVGFSVGAFYVPLNSMVAKWFPTNRGLALAILSAGLGLSVFLVAPFTRWLINLFDWRIAMLVMGDIAWVVAVPVALTLRNAPPEAAVAGEPVAAGGERYSMATIVRSPRFWAIAMAHFACCAAHSGPMFHMVTHVADQGISKMIAATVYGVSGLASIGGRLACGILADRFGAKRTLVAGLSLQAAMIALYLVVSDVTAFYALAVVFGMAYGGVMPLYALVTRDYFGEKAMGTAFGGVFMISCLGMGLGSFAGGWFYDHLGTYAWLFAGSFVVGAAAVAVAASCPPARVAASSVPVTA